MKLFVDLLGIPNHPLIANLPSPLSGFLKPSIKLLFKLGFLDFYRAMMRLEGASPLILNSIFLGNPTTKHFPSDSEPIRGISI
jgi:hypothetical protein